MSKTDLERDAVTLAKYAKYLLDLDPAPDREKAVNLGRVLLISAVYDRLVEWDRKSAALSGDQA